MKITRTTRRGMASVLAVLFVAIFATLAVSFYATTSIQTQVAYNDSRITKALLSAESGMDFMRYHLSRVSIPPGTPAANVIDELYTDLNNQLKDTGNLTGATIAKVGNVINIPAESTAFIALDSKKDTGFRATITDWAGEIVVRVEGRAGNGEFVLNRSVTMDFTRKQKSTSVFDFAVASKGQVLVSKGTLTGATGVNPQVASMMSSMLASPSVKVSGGTVGGDLAFVEGATIDVSGGNVGRSSVSAVILAEHVHEVDAPEFPTIDTNLYSTYATNAYVAGQKTQQNIRIPANTNPQFNGGDSVQGIMYIESPNVVTFRGNFNLQGFIVFENEGTSAQNVLDFRGNVAQLPLPAGATFDPLRATSGVALLAPTAAVSMSGSSDSFVRGSVIAGSFDFAGSADFQIDQGTLMTYDEKPASAYFHGKTVKFTGTGANNQPNTGVTYSSFFAPVPASYQEVGP